MNLEEAERYLVAYILRDESGARFRELAAIHAEYLPEPAAAAIWRTCRDLVAEDKALDLRDVARGASLTIPELAKHLGAIEDDGLTRTAASVVVDAWALRRSSRLLDRIVRQESSAGAIRAELDAIWEALDIFGGGSIEAKLLGARLDPNAQPPQLREVFRLNRTCIATPGNIVAVCAGSKAGKSAFIGAAIGSTMSEDSCCDFLGISGFNENRLAVVHVDTEQAPADHWKVIRTAMDRAGFETAPDWLHSYATAGWSPKDRRSALPHMLRLAKAVHGGLHAVFIDGAADLINDPNAGDECFPFVDELQALAVRFDCPIFVSLHLNPGSEKSRGHLGSHIERRSETNLVLEKDAETGKTVAYSTRQRRAPILKADGPCFRWDVQAGRHVSVGSVQADRDAAASQGAQELLNEVFGERPSMRYTELISALETTCKCSERTAGRKFGEMKKHGLIVRFPPNLWAKTS